MQRLHFSVSIQAQKERVWDILWNDATYRKWTRPFSEGSYAVSDWQEGSKVYFLAPSGDGMYSLIEKKIPNEFMSFKHLGEFKNKEEQAMSEWAGSYENYRLEENDGITTLSVDIDVAGEGANLVSMVDFFNEAFPKALHIVKELAEETMVKIDALINAPVEKIWDCWTKPEHITKWCQASEDWFAPRATNDLRVGGKFTTRMEARDGTMGFDFEGIYTNVKEPSLIEYVLADGRRVSISFIKEEDKYRVVESFDPEGQNPVEMQRAGWQAILDNFKKYVENL